MSISNELVGSDIKNKLCLIARLFPRPCVGALGPEYLKAHEGRRWRLPRTLKGGLRWGGTLWGGDCVLMTHDIAAHRNELLDGEASLGSVDKVLDNPEVCDLVRSTSRDWLLVVKRCCLWS